MEDDGEDQRAHLTPRVAWSLLRETCREWYADRAPRLGAALAFYTVFALAPGLILIIALAALLLGKEAAQGQIVSQVQDLAGVAGAQAVQAAIESARTPGAVCWRPASEPSRSCSPCGARWRRCTGPPAR